MRLLRVLPLAAVLVVSGVVLADDDVKASLKPPTVEIAGKLETGIMAIGGETTGTTITTADKKSYELDLHGDKALIKAAEGLSGKQAVASGTVTVKQGVEIGERRIIRVEALAAAPIAPK